MDENKRLKLVEIGYRVERSCGLCKHGRFVKNSDFGVCWFHTYQHLKHSDAIRNLSVLRYGSCPGFEMDKQAEGVIHKYSEFLSEVK